MSDRLHVVCLVGEPGVGKSTALGKFTEAYDREVVSHRLAGGPARETLQRDGQVVAVELGRREGSHPIGFPGTDAMSMSAIVGVEEWLVSGAAAAETRLVLLEGARLANRRFIKACIAAGARLTVAYLHDPAGAAERRQARGGGQNDAWVRGQGTRAANFYALAREAMVKTDADVHCEYVRADQQARVLDTLQLVTGLDRSPVA